MHEPPVEAPSRFRRLAKSIVADVTPLRVSPDYRRLWFGLTVSNLDSDLYFQQIIDSHVIDHLLAQRPPLGPEPQALQGLRGYVAGYNRYLKDVGGSKGVPDPTCRGKPWVHPITVAEEIGRAHV